MNSKVFYEIQLETFTKLLERCTNKVTLKKIELVISKYEQIIENYDSMSQRDSDECHCELCVMQG